MTHSWMKKWLCILACILLTLPGAAWAEEAPADESGALEVLLKSLGTVSSLDITISGSYSLNGNTGFRFQENAQVRAVASNGEVWLTCGGLTLNMGQSVTLTRHSKDGENGLYLSGSPRGGLYCGSLRLSASGSELRPVLMIDIEEYLYGVVPYEMNDAFPMEALKAQAVAARTYALKRRADRGGRDYDVVDTTADQVYMGYDAEYQNVVAAVDATKGVCGLYQGQYATCYYTASNGGQTAMAHDILGVTTDDGYLAIVDDPYDVENSRSPVTSLSLRADAYGLPELILSEMKAAASERLSSMNYSDELGDIFIDEITAVEPHTTKAGDPNRMYQYVRISFKISACPMVPVYSQPTAIDRIHELFGRNTYVPVLLGEQPGEPELLEDTFTCEIGVYDQLKNQLGLKISYIDCELCTAQRRQTAESDVFVVEFRRFGHGVGLSQRGAQQMAGQHGKTYLEILSFYYPGLSFEQKRFADQTLPAIDALPAGVAMAGSGAAASSQGELPALEEGERYAVVRLATAWSTLNVRALPSTEAEIRTTLANGWRVIVMEEADGWAHVRTAETEGYVSSQYLNVE